MKTPVADNFQSRTTFYMNHATVAVHSCQPYLICTQPSPTQLKLREIHAWKIGGVACSHLWFGSHEILVISTWKLLWKKVTSLFMQHWSEKWWRWTKLLRLREIPVCKFWDGPESLRTVSWLLILIKVTLFLFSFCLRRNISALFFEVRFIDAIVSIFPIISSYFA